MARPWVADPLLRHLEARRRLAEWRLRRVRRRGRKSAPWTLIVWLLLNVPMGAILATVAVQRVATAGDLIRYAVAVGLWAVITGIGLAVASLGGIIALEALGRYVVLRRKRRARGE